MKYRVVACLIAVASCNKGDDDRNEFATESGGVSKLPEAGAHLHEVARNAKRVLAKSGAFPIGTAKTLPDLAPTPTAKGCCRSVDLKCPVTQDWARDPVWKALDFHLDEPSNYRYSYESADGKSFTATAAGDLDCDGEEAVYTLSVKLDANGKPQTTIGKPAPNVL